MDECGDDRTMFRPVTEYMHPLAAPFQLEGERPDTVMLTHGWTGSPAHFRELGGILNEAGYGVVAPLLAGHGTAPADMVETGWRDWVRSALEAAMEVQADGKRLHLAGLSMGGLISLLLAATLDVASVTTINTPVVVRNRRFHLSVLYRGSKRIDENEPPVPAPPEMRQYQQQYHSTPVATIAELRDLIRGARMSLGRITCPALVIQSKADETVHPKSAEIIYDNLGSASKGLMWMEDARHAAVLDADRHLITEALLEHLEATAKL